MTSRPTASKTTPNNYHWISLTRIVPDVFHTLSPGNHLSPIGIETPTNFPFCSASFVFGTKFPKMIPTVMARNIQTARKRSRNPKFLKADTWFTPAFSSSLLTSATGSLADSRSGSGMLSVGMGVWFSFIVYLIAPVHRTEFVSAGCLCLIELREGKMFMRETVLDSGFLEYKSICLGDFFTTCFSLEVKEKGLKSFLLSLYFHSIHPLPPFSPSQLIS